MSRNSAARSSPARNLLEIPPIKRTEFHLLRAYIEDRAGIHLSDNKKALLVGRLSRRVRELGLRTFGAYYEFLLKHESSEQSSMLDCICTNETAFFREPKQFEYLRDHVFPQWQAEERWQGGERRIRAWSAGCSTGEEPYSLAMLLLDCFPKSEGWMSEITATDLSTKALSVARAGVWPARRAQGIPDDYARRFMLRGTGSQSDMVKAGDELRSAIDFGRLNLSKPPFSPDRTFDLILCRNVLIYFDHELRMKVIDHFIDHLSEGGLLLLGHAESLFGQTHRVRNLMPSVYALRDTGEETGT